MLTTENRSALQKVDSIAAALRASYDEETQRLAELARRQCQRILEAVFPIELRNLTVEELETKEIELPDVEIIMKKLKDELQDIDSEVLGKYIHVYKTHVNEIRRNKCEIVNNLNNKINVNVNDNDKKLINDYLINRFNSYSNKNVDDNEHDHDHDHDHDNIVNIGYINDDIDEFKEINKKRKFNHINENINWEKIQINNINDDIINNNNNKDDNKKIILKSNEFIKLLKIYKEFLINDIKNTLLI